MDGPWTDTRMKKFCAATTLLFTHPNSAAAGAPILVFHTAVTISLYSHLEKKEHPCSSVFSCCATWQLH